MLIDWANVRSIARRKFIVYNKFDLRPVRLEPYLSTQMLPHTRGFRYCFQVSTLLYFINAPLYKLSCDPLTLVC